ncbi:MAG TPA: M56 family metallopeptidase [Patescibacteria group bacterium]
MNQPYQWYAGVFLMLIATKLLTTVLKSQTESASRVKKLPKKVANIVTRHGFPVSRVQYLASVQSLAFTSGFLTPKINVSQGLVRQLTTKQLEAVILHEIYHARHYHPVQIALAKVLSSVLALLPVVDDVTQYYHLLLETRADDFAYSQQRSTRYLKGALSKMLISPVPHLALGFAHSALDQRIGYLLHQRRPILRVQPLKALTSTLVLLACVWYSQQWQAAQALEESFNISQPCTLTQCVSQCVNETWFTPAPTFSPDISYSSVK